MLKKIVGFIDPVIGLAVALLFLATAAAAIVCSKILRSRRDDGGDIKELYLSIVDPRETGIPTQREDMLLMGFKKKIFCYYFDFENTKNETSFFEENILINVVSVHPDNAFCRLGFVKSAACLVEIKTVHAMLKTVLKEGVNIIRAQDAHILGFNAYLLSRLANVPFIVQVCSNYEIKDRQARGLAFRPFIFKGIERSFERAIMRSADLVLADREHYRSFGLIPGDIPEEKYGNMGFFVSDAHYAPPSSRRDLRGELKIPPEKKIILYVGRLAEVKYPLDLVKMFALCLKKRRDLVLLIAGDGVLQSEMERMAGEGDFGDKVMFLNKLPQHKLVDLYNTADVVSFTSAGFTMIEAALAEKCIVAYDFEWHSEFVGKNDRGILVPFRDAAAFAKEVLKVLEDLRLREDMGKAARAYALANYTRQAAIEKEINFYKGVLRKRGSVIEEETVGEV
jgi:glycosyltransferase involved in cell wall biosynthesis